MPNLRWLLCVTCLTVTPFLAGAQTSAQVELELGMDACKHAKFEEAIFHFKNATALDPENEAAHQNLANAYLQNFIPGVDIPDNVATGEAAIREYQAVLRINPRSLESVKKVAYISSMMKKFDDAKSFYRKALGLDSVDVESYYSIGMIDWTQAYSKRMAVRTKLALKVEQPLIDAPECWDVWRSNEQLVTEGIDSLSRAIELRRDYDDAMAYMNLMFREKAEIQCGNLVEYAANIKAADSWVDQTIATKKRKQADADRKAATLQEAKKP